ncbi:MAG: hypothetical protein K8J08_04110, partial [Thermoanaerobaculia bacterium]|nr:hypothetical protein [Thermoanaerobaculia bacterium]
MEHLVWSGLESAEKDDAVRAWSDEHNRSVLTPLLWILAATGLGMAIAALTGPSPWQALFPAIVVPMSAGAIVLLRRWLRLRESSGAPRRMDRVVGVFWHYFRVFTLLYPVVTALLLVAAFWGGWTSPIVFMMPFVILMLRFRAADRWLAHLGLAMIGLADVWSADAMQDGGFSGILVINGILLLIGLW